MIMDNIRHPTNLQCCKVNKFRDRPKARTDPARRASLSNNAEKDAYVPEGFSYNRIQCPRCRYNIREANQLYGYAQIDYSDVICEHCRKRIRFNNVCSKCENAVSRILSNRSRDDKTKTRLKLWLSNVQQELRDILMNTNDAGVCTNELKDHVFSETYLGDLYGKLHSPTSPRKPDVRRLLNSGFQRHYLDLDGKRLPRSEIQRPSTAISMPDLGECCHVPDGIEKWAETIEARERDRVGPGSDHSDQYGDMRLHAHEYKKPSRRRYDGYDDNASHGRRRLSNHDSDVGFEDGTEKSRSRKQESVKSRHENSVDFDKIGTSKPQSEKDINRLNIRGKHKNAQASKGSDGDYYKTGVKGGKEQTNKERARAEDNRAQSVKEKDKLKPGTKNKAHSKEKDNLDTAKTKSGTDVDKSKAKSKAAVDIATIMKSDEKQGKPKSKKTEIDGNKSAGDKLKDSFKDQAYDSPKQGQKVGGKRGKNETEESGLAGDNVKDSKSKDKKKVEDEVDKKQDQSAKKGKEKPTKEDEEFLLSIKKAKAEREKEKEAAKLAAAKKQAETKKMAEIEKPQVKLKSIKTHRQTKTQDFISASDRALEALNVAAKKDEITKIIVGQRILRQKKQRVTLEEREASKEKAQAPMLFKAVADFDDNNILTGRGDAPTPISTGAASSGNDADTLKRRKTKDDSKTAKPGRKVDKQSANAEPEVQAGITRYALSDRTFIDKGWTQLPTEKVVRKMNVYRMRPAHPEFDWFARNKNRRLVEYDSGEKMAEIDDKGRGKWFYRNGRLALDYYDAEELNAQQRFVLYSSGEPDERGRSRPITVLGTFDYLGNGVVFDHGGKIRLKYNQTEGVVLDRSLGPVSHWKWHSLNDPPVLQQVMIDTQMPQKDPDIAKLGGPSDNKPRQENEEMLAIEFDNFIKEKSKKLSQKFKPFQIKMKALKINEHFSLRVLDQASIYLIFRDGSTNLKLNMGMILDHQEIVDTDTAELGEVASATERRPARTDSLAALQRSVALAQRYEQARCARQLRLRPVAAPAASADRLTAARAPPLRRPLHTVPPLPACDTATKESAAAVSDQPTVGKCRCISRKLCSNNIYYDNRL